MGCKEKAYLVLANRYTETVLPRGGAAAVISAGAPTTRTYVYVQSPEEGTVSSFVELMFPTEHAQLIQHHLYTHMYALRTFSPSLYSQVLQMTNNEYCLTFTACIKRSWSNIKWLSTTYNLSLIRTNDAHRRGWCKRGYAGINFPRWCERRRLTDETHGDV